MSLSNSDVEDTETHGLSTIILHQPAENVAILPDNSTTDSNLQNSGIVILPLPDGLTSESAQLWSTESLSESPIPQNSVIPQQLYEKNNVYSYNNKLYAVIDGEFQPIELQSSDICSALDENATITIQNIEDDETLKRKRPEEIIEPPIGKGPYKCLVCEKIFDKYPLLIRHKKTHANEKPHCCDHCNASFNHEENLKIHMSIHTKSDRPTCSQCGKSFKRLASLKAHIHYHLQDETLMCTECGDEFSSLYNLDKHMNEHTLVQVQREKRTLTCKYPQCKETFDRASSLREHQKQHQIITASMARKQIHKKVIDRTHFSHACVHCEKRFQKPSQLERHTRIHTGERPYKCKMCSKAFNQSGALKLHMPKHTKERPHKCDLCLMTFSQRGNLRAHIARLHSINPGEENKRFKCDYCPCMFRKLGSMNSHVSRFHPKAEAGLNIESYKYPPTSEANPNDSTSQNLDVQGSDPGGGSGDILSRAMENSGVEEERIMSQNVHEELPELTDSVSGGTRQYQLKICVRSGVKWHQCDYCSKEFRKPSDLIRHIRVHTHERPYACNQCNKRFAIKSTLTNHKKTHLGIKEYSCAVCSKHFASLASLKVHQRLHTGSKPFVCTQCDKRFRTAGHKNAHIQTHSRKNSSSAGVFRRKVNAISGQSNNFIESLPEVQLSQPLRKLPNGTLLEQAPRKAKFLGDQIDPDRPHKCDYCLRGFKKSSHLKQHIRRHTGERPYNCIKCLRSFSSASVLKQHIRTHTGQKSYKCEDCESNFSTKGSLMRHKTTHSEERPYVCPYCHKTFKTTMNCKKHINTHKYELKMQVFEDNRDLGLIANDQSNVAVEQDPSGCLRETTTVVSEASNQVFTQSVQPSNIVQEEQTLPEVTFQEQVNTGINYTSNVELNSDFVPTNAIADSIDPQLYALNQIDTSNASILTQVLNAAGVTGVTGVTVVSEDESHAVGTDYTIASGIETQHVESFGPLKYVFSDPNRLFFKCALCSKLAPDQLEYDRHMREAHPQTDPATAPALIDTQLENVIDSVRTVSAGRGRNNTQVIKLSDEQAEKLSKTEPNEKMSLSEKLLIESARERSSLSYDQQVKSTRILDMIETNVTETPTISSNSSSQGASISNGESAPLSPTATALVPTSHQSCSNTVTLSVQVENLNEEKQSKQRRAGKSTVGHNKCEFCNKVFKKPSDLARHVRTHTGEKPFACPTCHRTFTVKSTLDTHLKIHQGKQTKEYSCHMCNTSFASKGSLKVHMRLHTGSRPFKCAHCSQTFRTSGHRKSHQQNHLKGDSPTKSRKRTNRGGLISDYERRDRAAKQLQDSNQQPHIFDMNDGLRPSGVIALLESENDLPNSQLQINPADFQMLVEHAGNMMDLPVDPNSDMAEQDSSQCARSHPTSVVIDTSEIERYGVSVTDIQQDGTGHPIFLFSAVDNRSKDDENAVTPIVVQTAPSMKTERAHKCKFCGKAFKRAYHLSEHLRDVHGEGEQNRDRLLTNANIVRNHFKKPSQLQRHIRIHTGERPFQCDLCDKAFNQKNALNMHLKKHSGDKQHHCPHCNQGFVQKGNLKTHMRRAHSQKVTDQNSQLPFDSHLGLEDEPLSGDVPKLLFD